jgi:hypothetical protein
MFRKISICTVLVAALVGCGGGGGDSGNEGLPLLPGATVLTVSGDALFRSASYSTITNLVQNPTSGYATTPSLIVEWSGQNLGYTQGYTGPTSGTLRSFSAQFLTGSAAFYTISNADYNVSQSRPSVNYDQVASDALSAATETRILGGDGNDKVFAFSSTTEIDLGRGTDTLVLSQDNTAYNFKPVSGQINSVTVSRDGWTITVRNVELFEFANGTKSLAEILAAGG